MTGSQTRGVLAGDLEDAGFMRFFDIVQSAAEERGGVFSSGVLNPMTGR